MTARASWTPAPIARGGTTPLHDQLAALIRARVRAGELAPGDRLPPERNLAALAGISRMTARQAVAALVRDGTLAVRHGVGTFVAEPKRTYDALHLLGFSEATTRQGGVVASRVLEQTVAVPPPAVAAALGLAAGEDAVAVVRLRLVDGEPVLLETSTLSAARCPGLEGEDLERHSLYDLLATRYGVRLRRARQTIEAAAAGADQGGLFGVPTGSPMLVLDGVAFDEEDRPTEHFKAVYRGDRLKLTMESRRRGGEPVGESAGIVRASIVPA